jgi:hypothetical protein
MEGSPTAVADNSFAPSSVGELETSSRLASTLPAAPAVPDSEVIPLVDSLLELGAASAPPTVSESTIAENLATVRAETPGMVVAAAPLPSGHAETPGDDLVIEPALKMEVRNPRHARVLLAMADNPSIESPGGDFPVRDRFARGLDHENPLSNSASRLGVGGDRFSVSF